ncbi:hypothetical protein R1X32_04525 (plasmid) [Rhodococcus opacus]|nr:hypothetical protein HJ581_0042570 [Rhodococcus opacus]
MAAKSRRRLAATTRSPRANSPFCSIRMWQLTRVPSAVSSVRYVTSKRPGPDAPVKAISAFGS